MKKIMNNLFKFFCLLLFGLLIWSCKASDEKNNYQENFSERRWLLRVLQNEEITTLPEAREIFINFNAEEKRFGGFAGCNSFSGIYSLDENKLNLERIVSTKMMCPEIDTETKLFTVLQEINSFRMEDDKLILLKGETVMAEFITAR
jgi:heat shock protein HslJ